MPKGVYKETYQRIETIEGRTTAESITAMYVNGTTSMKGICKKWGINGRTLVRIFRELGFEIKPASISVANQWINADQRRINTSNKMKETIKSIPHPRLGFKDKAQSERMKVNNPMFDIKTRKRANDKTIQTYKEDPTRHKQFHAPLTECEQIVFDMLTKSGIICIGNELINGRFVDIFIPSLNIGIECVNHSRFPLSYDRHKQITQNNVHIIYATNHFIKSKNIFMLNKYITNSYIDRLHPTSSGEVSMIFGRARGVVFDADSDKFTVKTINMNGCYLMEVSTTAGY